MADWYVDTSIEILRNRNWQFSYVCRVVSLIFISPLFAIPYLSRWHMACVNSVLLPRVETKDQTVFWPFIPTSLSFQGADFAIPDWHDQAHYSPPGIVKLTFVQQNPVQTGINNIPKPSSDSSIPCSKYRSPHSCFYRQGGLTWVSRYLFTI